MDGSILITIVFTIIGVLLLERYYQSKKAAEEKGDEIYSRPSYREEAFAEIIKINEDTLKKGVLDSLTSLPGREIFDERLDKILAHSRQYNQIFSVMILNIDEFTNINHVYGNVVGNRVLAEATNRMRSVLRQIDTVSRYAGDTFTFILPELSNPEVALLVAQRIQDSIIQPFVIESHHIFLTASIGIAIYDSQYEDAKKLLGHAQEALTKAKLCGRNTYRIYDIRKHGGDEQQAEFAANFSSLSFLEHLVMYYQPYINVTNNKIVAIQAVPYFKDEKRGLIPYEEFKYLLEENGKIIEMGEWQLQTVINQINKWKEQGFHESNVIIEISLTELENSEYLAGVAEKLNHSDIQKSQITLEISEDNIKSNNKNFIASLLKVQDSGIRVSISILALGRLALHNILDFPINYLKIDEKLVKGLTTNIDNEAIIVSLITLSNNTNIKVIAETIDFENQKAKLLELGCSIMKGKMFSLPVTNDEIIQQELKTHAQI